MILTGEKLRQRAEWLLSPAVCETKRGVKTHLDIISFDDLRCLIMYLHCSLEDVIEVVFERTRKRGRKSNSDS